ncbi:MAG: PIN domain-containing protein, partial [Synergistaceae bacterium]|nr:PIN domain-containing protein [Synergistaceae bacterium]
MGTWADHVIDTNVLVSALSSPGRKAWDIVTAAIARRFTPCFDSQMLSEHDRVLRHPK